MLFVLTLQLGRLQYQFQQLAWTHLIVFFTVVPSSFFVPLIFEGLMWFFLPVSLIIVNDIMAYLAGVTSIRTIVWTFNLHETLWRHSRHICPPI